MPESYLGRIACPHFHHFTKTTLEGLATNEAVPRADPDQFLTQRSLTAVLYPAIDHNGALHRNVGVQNMVTSADILTIVIEGLATVADDGAQVAPVAARYGIDGEIARYIRLVP